MRGVWKASFATASKTAARVFRAGWILVAVWACRSGVKLRAVTDGPSGVEPAGHRRYHPNWRSWHAEALRRDGSDGARAVAARGGTGAAACDRGERRRHA